MRENTTKEVNFEDLATQQANACDVCDEFRPCVKRCDSCVGETWACHRCRSLPDNECEDCTEVIERGEE